MKIYYRISDNSYLKPKLPGATKKFCLENFLSIFCQEDIHIICDNVNDETFNMVQSLHSNVERTALSNAGSLRHAMTLAVRNFDNEEIYFVEDDYLHFKGKNLVKVIQEGLSLMDYVTLYDHPDKYSSDYGYGESSICFKTKNSHWRTTVSTCMTFAVKSETLKSDWFIWDRYTQSSHPYDHQIFTALAKEKDRHLALSIPGLACHMDLTYSLEKGKDDFFDEWALNLLEKELLKGLEMPCIWDTLSGYKKLLLLDTIAKKSN